MKRFVLEYTKGDIDPNDPNRNGDSKVAGKDNPAIAEPADWDGKLVVGDRVHVKGDSAYHPWHRGKMATVKEVGESTASVKFDDDPDRVQSWFFNDQVKPLHEEASNASAKKALKPGDRIYVKGDSQHHPMHRGKVGTVHEIGKPALAMAFDESPDHTQRWFVHDDVKKVSEACSDTMAKNKFGGVKRSDLKDGDFLYPETRSFPIKTAKDVKDAMSDFGRSGSKDSYETFIHKLWNKAKGLGIESAIPQSTRDKYNLK